MANIPYAISERTNPSVILGILLGQAELTAKDKQSVSNTLIERLVSDFRAQIEQRLPVFYLLDCTEIFNIFLSEIDSKGILQSEAKHKILSKINVPFTTDFYEAYGDTQLEFTKKDYYNKNTSFQDLYEEVYDYLFKNRQAITADLNRELRSKISNTITLSEISTKLQDSMQYIASTIADLVDVGGPQREITTSTKVSSAREVGRILRETFPGTKTIVSDPERMVAGFDSNTMTLVTASSYGAVTTDVHNIITNKLIQILKTIPVNFQHINPERQITINISGSVELILNSKFKIGNLVAAGHAAVKSSNRGVIGINTPALQLATLILQANNRPVPGFVKQFIDDAGHTPFAIDIVEDFSGTAENFINIQISFLRSQRASINSGQISTDESNFFDKMFKRYLDQNYQKIRQEYLNRLSSNKVLDFFTDKFNLSPTFKQNIANRVLAAISGDKTYKGSSGNLNAPVPNSSSNASIKKPKILNTKKIQAQKPKTKISPARRVSKIAKPTLNLSNLQNIINTLLHQQIRQNMGDGNRQDVLNYRTGRFAQSATVERITQGREGMISAYYTYMKYPYATFSEGGRQEFPRSRDPKLLISKSIREIMQQQMITRMRAVLI